MYFDVMVLLKMRAVLDHDQSYIRHIHHTHYVERELRVLRLKKFLVDKQLYEGNIAMHASAVNRVWAISNTESFSPPARVL